MSHQQLLMSMPDIQMEELSMLQNLMQTMNDRQKEQFLLFYRTKRKDKQTMLIIAAIGFLGFAGIHRFLTGEIGLGILYILTLGLCFIGTIIDILNIGQITAAFNEKQAIESAGLVRMMGA